MNIKSKRPVQVQRGRIFVKNLPFSATETIIHEHFSKYGMINHVNLLRRPNSDRLVGCCFVQFETTHAAMEAVNGANGGELTGRKISCQIAQFKDRNGQTIKKEPTGIVGIPVVPKVEVKEEPTIGDENGCTDEPATSTTENDEIVSDDDGNEENSDNSESDDDSANSMTEGDQSQSKLKAIKPVGKNSIQTTGKRTFDLNDASQERTVFVKNVPFDVTKDVLHECMSQFGPVEYAMIVMDKFTEHSRGTAFVKFKEKEATDLCLAAGTELQVNGQILDCQLALTRDVLQRKSDGAPQASGGGYQDGRMVRKDDKPGKFQRNLHLLNEGAIFAGSDSSKTISAADMTLRVSLQQERARRVRADPNLFLSDTRLIVHNLPVDWDEKRLRALLDHHVKSNFHCKEMRIMRERKDRNASKCYAYIGCRSSEIAMKLLKALNNSPTAFGAKSQHKRPIVAFSIENRQAIQKKERRKQNVTGQQDKAKTKATSIPNIKSVSITTKNSSTTPVGGNANKVRAKHNVKRQLELHRDHIKQRKKQQRASKVVADKWNKRKADREPKSMPARKKHKANSGQDDFAQIVNKYKSGLDSAMNATKSKWYESAK